MITKICIKGCVIDYNRIVHLVDEHIGYCRDDPLDVIKGFANTHIIHDYKGFSFPFYPRGFKSQCGLEIRHANDDEMNNQDFSGVSTFIELMSKIDQPRKVTPINPKSCPEGDSYRISSENDSYYFFNPSEIEYSLRLEEKLTDTQLKNKFRERLLEGVSSFNKFNYWKPNRKEYWLKLDQELFKDMYWIYGQTSSYNDDELYSLLELDRDIWDRTVRIKEILPELRNARGYDLEKENNVYNEIHKEANLIIPLELLKLFGIEQASYHDLEDLLFAKNEQNNNGNLPASTAK